MDYLATLAADLTATSKRLGPDAPVRDVLEDLFARRVIVFGPGLVGYGAPPDVRIAPPPEEAPAATEPRPRKTARKAKA